MTRRTTPFGHGFWAEGISEPTEFVLTDKASLALHRAAEKRGVTPGEMGRRIIETVAREGLIDAVLDDASEAVAA